MSQPRTPRLHQPHTCGFPRTLPRGAACHPILPTSHIKHLFTHITLSHVFMGLNKNKTETWDNEKPSLLITTESGI